MHLNLHGFEKHWKENLEEKKPVRNYAKTCFPVSFPKNAILVSVLTKDEYYTRLKAVLVNPVHFRAMS